MRDEVSRDENVLGIKSHRHLNKNRNLYINDYFDQKFLFILRYKIIYKKTVQWDRSHPTYIKKKWATV